MTKQPLTGYEKEIAILHAEANQSAELIEEFKGTANEYKQAVERVRKLHKKDDTGYCELCTAIATPDGSDYLSKYPCPTIQALDGDE